MTRLFRPSAPQASLKARSIYGTALALSLAVASFSTGSAAFAQEAPAPAAASEAQMPATPADNNAASQPAMPAATPDNNAAPAASPAPENATAAATSQAPVTAKPVSDKPVEKENPYGLKALWSNGDIIARGVLLIMAIMSAGTWIIMVMKFLEQSRLFNASRHAASSFWTQKSVQEGAKILKEDSPFRYIAETGIVAAEHHDGSMRDSIDLPTWTSMSIERSVKMINSRLQGGLAFLGTVGSTSPFVGLFGTVWGIYHALTAIGIAGQASIDKVAGPVGESLIMTAIGLATAVPAVLGYNLLVRRNKAAMERVTNFASDMHSVLLGGYRHEAAFNAQQQAAPTTITTNQKV